MNFNGQLVLIQMSFPENSRITDHYSMLNGGEILDRLPSGVGTEPGHPARPFWRPGFSLPYYGIHCNQVQVRISVAYFGFPEKV